MGGCELFSAGFSIFLWFVNPKEDPDDPLSDPITESNLRKGAGDFAGAEKLLHEMCEFDLRCLDAHAHLGNLESDHRRKNALRHYEIGLRIGESSLGADFDRTLLWRMIDNRPFLTCLHGYGLCLGEPLILTVLAVYSNECCG